MKTFIIVGTIVSILFSISMFVSTYNIIFTLVTLIISLIYFLAIGMPLFKKHENKIARFHECYQFINTFIISLSIKGSIKGALESTFETMGDRFHNEIEGMVELNESEKINYLSQYFPFHNYGLFVNLINLWSEQGGNIIDMSTYLINDLRLKEEYLIESDRIAKKHITEFAILWLLSLIILISLRFALSQFYEKLSQQLFFPIAVLIILVFALLTIHIALMRMTKVDIRGWNDAK